MIASSAYKTSLVFLLSGIVCLFFADLEVVSLDPWAELGRIAMGFVTPNFLVGGVLINALMNTLAFAVLGVALGAAFGFALALVFHLGPVRWFSAFVRSIHEIFWALLFLQMVGLNPLTGLLAIAVPYAGTFAKVYAEILEEADPDAVGVLPVGAGLISGFFYAKIPDVWAHLRSYTTYRLECGLRSSAVLGFVGLPTLGFHLDAYFSQGAYSQAAALLILFYLLIGSLRLWLRPRLLPLFVVAALVVVWGPVDASWANVSRFFLVDIVPAPLRGAVLSQPETLGNLSAWSRMLFQEQILPGAISTLVLAQIALVGSGILTLGFFPLVSRQFFGPVGRFFGHGFLVVVRSTPEYILAYLFLQLWGPSMLPAILALALHNGAIIGHLTGRHADQIILREDAPKGLNRYGYEILPRVYGQFMAFLFYRWEVILRETAILGILGIHTLGFFVDSAIADIRLDRAMVVIGFTALLNIGVDAFSRNLRAKLRLSRMVDEV